MTYTLDGELADDLASGRRRPEWLWVGLRGERVVARAGWWGPSGGARPALLDFLDIAENPLGIEIGLALLEAAQAELFPNAAQLPDYIRFIPPDWREHAGSRRTVEDRMEIASGAGAKLLVERLRFDWHPGTPIPEPTGRLTFREVGDDAQLVDLMTSVLAGTLDMHSQRALGQMSARDVASRHFQDELAGYASPREWWRIATLADGDPVGFVTPARNDYNAILAYLGVLPAHRGKGYVDELLAEGIRILANQKVPRIRASTDLDNLPMAAAFIRAGWDNFERAITMTWA